MHTQSSQIIRAACQALPDHPQHVLACAVALVHLRRYKRFAKHEARALKAMFNLDMQLSKRGAGMNSLDYQFHRAPARRVRRYGQSAVARFFRRILDWVFATADVPARFIANIRSADRTFQQVIEDANARWDWTNVDKLEPPTNEQRRAEYERKRKWSDAA